MVKDDHDGDQKVGTDCRALNTYNAARQRLRFVGVLLPVEGAVQFPCHSNPKTKTMDSDHHSYSKISGLFSGKCKTNTFTIFFFKSIVYRIQTVKGRPAGE